jgi:hypothetical protein
MRSVGPGLGETDQSKCARGTMIYYDDRLNIGVQRPHAAKNPAVIPPKVFPALKPRHSVARGHTPPSIQGAAMAAADVREFAVD